MTYHIPASRLAGGTAGHVDQLLDQPVPSLLGFMKTATASVQQLEVTSASGALSERHRAPDFRSTSEVSDCNRSPEASAVLTLPIHSAAELMCTVMRTGRAQPQR